VLKQQLLQASQTTFKLVMNIHSFLVKQAIFSGQVIDKLLKPESVLDLLVNYCQAHFQSSKLRELKQYEFVESFVEFPKIAIAQVNEKIVQALQNQAQTLKTELQTNFENNKQIHNNLESKVQDLTLQNTTLTSKLDNLTTIISKSFLSVNDKFDSLKNEIKTFTTNNNPTETSKTPEVNITAKISQTPLHSEETTLYNTLEPKSSTQTILDTIPETKIPEDPFLSQISAMTLADEFDSGHSAGLNKLIFIENDTKYITCSRDGFIQIFNSQNDKLLKKLQGHYFWVNDIIMLTNGHLASCAVDNSIKIWDIKEGICIHTLNGHKEMVNCLLEVPGLVLISGSSDKTIRFWNVNDTEQPTSSSLKTIQNPNQLEVQFHAICQLAEHAIAIGSKNDINIYQLTDEPNLVFLRKLSGHKDWVSSLVVTKGIKMLISASYDKSCKAWNMTGECVRTFSGHMDAVFGMVVLSESVFVTCSAEIKVWSIHMENAVKTIEQNKSRIKHLEVTKDRRIFSCGDDKIIREYKL